jgi:hypothetical protein
MTALTMSGETVLVRRKYLDQGNYSVFALGLFRRGRKKQGRRNKNLSFQKYYIAEFWE